MRRAFFAVFVSWACLSGSAFAQDAQTLADIRQELTVLNVEIQQLRRELSTTGAPSTNLSGSSVLERVSAIETELVRLTSQTEQLDHRINNIVADGTNRIGDLEFRLVELEGGDVSKLGETSTLGGETPTAAPVVPTPAPVTDQGSQLAVGEQADYDAAVKALNAGDYRSSADLLATFDQNYPGSPLSAKAHLTRGMALAGLGDTREAARAYLASFTSNSTGPEAPGALYNLGASLGELGQVDQACVTLGEVGVRFPSADAVAQARDEMAKLGCS